MVVLTDTGTTKQRRNHGCHTVPCSLVPLA